MSEYSIVGTVPIDQMPKARRGSKTGVRSEIIRQAIDGYATGTAIVVRFPSQDAANRFRAGIGNHMRTNGYRISYATVPEDDGTVLSYFRAEPVSPNGAVQP